MKSAGAITGDALVESAPMATRKKRPVDEEKLLARARAAAKKRKLPGDGNELSRSEALAEAPWKVTYPPVWERPFREAYADALKARGGAVAAKAAGKASGTRGEQYKTKLMGRLLYQTEEEFEAQSAVAKKLGLPWSTWARRRLAT